jgi:hypothetical protein
MVVATVFLIPAATLSLVWWVPQLVRVVRDGPAGVSAETWAISAANLVVWGIWALAAGQPVVVAAEWVPAAGSCAIVLAVGATRRSVWLAVAVTLVALASHFWAPAASMVALSGVIVVRAPQLVKLRAGGTPGDHSVSTLTWATVIAGNIMWLGWGVTSGHPVMAAGAVLAIVISGAIVWAARPARAQQPATEPAIL